MPLGTLLLTLFTLTAYQFLTALSKDRYSTHPDCAFPQGRRGFQTAGSAAGNLKVLLAFGCLAVPSLSAGGGMESWREICVTPAGKGSSESPIPPGTLLG